MAGDVALAPDVGARQKIAREGIVQRPVLAGVHDAHVQPRVPRHPQERGINPDNVSDEEYRNEYFNEEIDEDGGWTVKKLFFKKTFWLVAVASGGFQFVSTIIITQLVVRNQEVGFTQAQALTIMTILAFAGIVGS